MANERFTRDEVILALDVLYSSSSETVDAKSIDMKELSILLNDLPIYSKKGRRRSFRSPTGIAKQIKLMQSNIRTGKKDPNVGQLFFEIAFEFYDRREELHQIATAIRKNEQFFFSEFGGTNEDEGFPEGVLLGHLHCIIEKRDGSKVTLADHCEICDIKPDQYYWKCESLLQAHLLVPPVEISGEVKYKEDCFITVCPNCHAALHRIRPWHIRENCADILR